MRGHARHVAVALAGRLALAGLLAAASLPAAGVTGPAVPGVAAPASPPAAGELSAPNNSTVPRHRDPATVDRAGDLAATSEWLAGHLAERLGEGAVRVERGQYDAARRVVGDRFDDRLDRLVDVAAATDDAGDDRLAARLSLTRERQARFTDAVADYRETRRAYLAARRAGNTTRARALARDLERTAETADETGRALAADYAWLDDETDADLAGAAERVRGTRENVTGRQATVSARAFVATRLVVGAPRRSVSVTDPLSLRGRLLAADGTALSNRSVRLRVGDRTLGTRTNATGGFAVQYRPVLLPANATAIRVAYRPRDRSPYLGSAASVPVSVRPVPPSVAVAARPSPARFGDRVSVAGTVTVGGTGLPGVPVVVRVGGTRLGRVETLSNGSFALSARLPADVAAGDRRVAARVALSGRAVAATAGTTTLTVAPTAAELSLSARRVDGPEQGVAVAGRLTADGRPVAGREVALRLNGSHVRTVTTGDDGRYAATLAAGNRPEGAPVAVAAVHDGTASNLDDAAARTTLPGDGSTGRPWPGGLSAPALAAAVAVAVLAVGGTVARSRWRGGGSTPDPAADAGPASDDGPSLAPARSHLAAGDAERAVVAAYAAVREGLGDGSAPRGGPALTHREFHLAHEGTVDEGARDLRVLTDTYERAAFAPDGPTRDEAAAALAAAAALLAE